MAVTIAKEKYPAFTGEVGVSGKRIILYINYGTGASEASPKWIKLGGLTSNTHSVSAEVKTAQTKDTGYWADGVVTSKTHELDAEVVMRRDNEAQKVIEEFLYDDAITAEKALCSLPSLIWILKNTLSVSTYRHHGKRRQTEKTSCLTH